MTMRSVARLGVCVVFVAAVGTALAGPAAAAAPPSGVPVSATATPTTTPVGPPPATVGGQVFGDANSNGRADPGEGVGGVKITLFSRDDKHEYEVTTGSGGRFSVPVVPAAYDVTGSGSGWYLIERTVKVGASGATLALRAVRPLGDVLKAGLQFTEDSYAPGDKVRVLVTLTNTGSATLRGIGPACDRAGDPDELANTGRGWGNLVLGGPGVILGAHSARTFAVTDAVPDGAQRLGQVVVACDFGYFGVEAGHRPVAEAKAAVPGLSGALAVDVDHYPHGHSGSAVGLANVRAVLVDSSACPVFTRTARTNADGRFRIAAVPAGSSYELYLDPPAGWKVIGQNPAAVFVIGDDTVHDGFEVERGSARVPVVQTPPCAPSTSAAAPPISVAPPTGRTLANTGSDPSGLAAAGGAAVLIGLVLLVGTRRRRSH